jgi:hypothetical protein
VIDLNAITLHQCVYTPVTKPSLHLIEFHDPAAELSIFL